MYITILSTEAIINLAQISYNLNGDNVIIPQDYPVSEIYPVNIEMASVRQTVETLLQIVLHFSELVSKQKKIKVSCEIKQTNPKHKSVNWRSASVPRAYSDDLTIIHKSYIDDLTNVQCVRDFLIRNATEDISIEFWITPGFQLHMMEDDYALPSVQVCLTQNAFSYIASKLADKQKTLSSSKDFQLEKQIGLHIKPIEDVTPVQTFHDLDIEPGDIVYLTLNE